ncbi:hypothetical protein [Methylosinus sp. RM1]|uniref:hypothetical protein n=1 Tax=Methylosinus sp. RM1 TaxID=2583817 RepID=UPI001A9C9806|nr:hypothetical protein [Methylosinus sp. RM1]
MDQGEDRPLSETVRLFPRDGGNPDFALPDFALDVAAKLREAGRRFAAPSSAAIIDGFDRVEEDFRAETCPPQADLRACERRRASRRGSQGSL